MPAVVCTGLCEVATRVGAPRIVRAGRFHHPFGDPEISPDRELVWRKSLVREALDRLAAPAEA